MYHKFCEPIQVSAVACKPKAIGAFHERIATPHHHGAAGLSDWLSIQEVSYWIAHSWIISLWYYHNYNNTIFPQNLAVVRFYFKAPFGAATIRGWLDFECGIYRDQHSCAYTINLLHTSIYECTYNACVHMHTSVDPLLCSKISRAVFIEVNWQKYVATFQGWRDFEVWQDFKEIRYPNSTLNFCRVASEFRVFCDMTLTCKGVGGGCMQVAKLDMINSSHQCPSGTRLRTGLLISHSKHLCGSNFYGPGCSSTTFAISTTLLFSLCAPAVDYTSVI